MNKTKILYGGGVFLGISLFVLAYFFIFPLVQEKGWQHLLREEEIIEPPTVLKIGFVTDWEYGSRKQMKHKLTNQAPTELQKVVDFLNNEFHPDLVIGGGDYIESSGVKKEKAKLQLTEINNIFKTVQAPRLYALGNHDMRALTKEEVRAILEIPENHASQDIGDWRVIVLDTNFNKEDDSDRAEKSYVTGYVSQSELAWLRQVLETDRPVIVFSHHSPKNIPNRAGTSNILNIINSAEVQGILEERGNVVAIVSGHNPQNYYEEHNGIHYFVVDTLVNESALGSFGTIELEYLKSKRYAEISLRQHGIRPAMHNADWQYGEKEKDILPEPVAESEEESEAIMTEEGE